MPDSKTYTGGCHCGQVRFECTGDLAMVTACNCSICTKKGLHFTFLDPKSFQLRAGEENLKEYLFNKHAIHHQLCVDCGVDVFARGKKPDGSVGTGQVGDEFVGINRRDGQEWKGLVEIVEREEQKAFTFITGGSALNFVQWGYRLEPDGAGTKLTQHWELRNLSPIMIENGDEEVQRRRRNALDSIEKTLPAIKAAAEAS